MFDYVALKKYIDDTGLKQKVFAQKAMMTQATMSAIINGRVKCSLDNYVNICKALAVPFGTFINEEPTPAA